MNNSNLNTFISRCKFLNKSIAIAILATVVSFSANATKKQIKPPYDVTVIEIKGIRLGMAYSEVNNTIPNYPTMTIGGVVSELMDKKFIDGKLSFFLFVFASDKFTEVLSAVLVKYPMTKCVNSVLENRMGASFSQVECLLTSKDGDLRLKKYGNDFNSGILSLLSNEELDNYIKDKAKKSGDI